MPAGKVFHSPIHEACKLPPLRETMQKFALYETKSRFYLVGSNAMQTRFRVLKIDRTDASRLQVEEDSTIYDRTQIHAMLTMIQSGNKHSGGLNKCLNAHGIIGFVKFLNGYYIHLITQLRKVGSFGGHIVYTIEDTVMIPIPHPSVQQQAAQQNPDRKKLRNNEARYKGLYNLMDLTKNFYISYTYDLTRTLQHTMIHASDPECSPPKDMYVWNHFLVQEFRRLVPNREWCVDLIHGFFEQTHCSIFGRMITLTLISRRSRFFAGTRYLKRGINDSGQVANDVETEQILHDRGNGSHIEGQYTSHVQLRASIPLFWAQESNPMIAKPAIVVQRVDPLYLGTRMHFEELWQRYGSPILTLNLVRQNERRHRESIIGGAFGEAVQFINQFLPEEHKIDYFAWDFKVVSKSKTVSVVDELAIIAHWSLQKTGLFHSTPHPDARPVNAEIALNLMPTRDSIEKHLSENKSHQRIAFLQRGVIRSNCIDSLDRTNVAQFCVGKCALGYQLHAMGIIDSCHTDTNSDLVQVLLDMYERMGDSLAMQYGGSQMHRQMKKDRAKTVTMAPVLYRQKQPTKSKEMFVSLMRHYQNSFQDSGKQEAMNLFLGYFIPPSPDLFISASSSDSQLKQSPSSLGDLTTSSSSLVESDIIDDRIRSRSQSLASSQLVGDRMGVNLWDLSSDYYLHNSPVELLKDSQNIGRCSYDKCDWFQKPIQIYEDSLIPYSMRIANISPAEAGLAAHLFSLTPISPLPLTRIKTPRPKTTPSSRTSCINRETIAQYRSLDAPDTPAPRKGRASLLLSSALSASNLNSTATSTTTTTVVVVAVVSASEGDAGDLQRDSAPISAAEKPATVGDNVPPPTTSPAPNLAVGAGDPKMKPRPLNPDNKASNNPPTLPTSRSRLWGWLPFSKGAPGSVQPVGVAKASVSTTASSSRPDQSHENSSVSQVRPEDENSQIESSKRDADSDDDEEVGEDEQQRPRKPSSRRNSESLSEGQQRSNALNVPNQADSVDATLRKDKSPPRERSETDGPVHNSMNNSSSVVSGNSSSSSNNNNNNRNPDGGVNNNGGNVKKVATLSSLATTLGQTLLGEDGIFSSKDNTVPRGTGSLSPFVGAPLPSERVWTSHELAFRHVYAPTEHSFFEEMAEDALFSIHNIQVKAESAKKTTLGQRIREKLPIMPKLTSRSAQLNDSSQDIGDPDANGDDELRSDRAEDMRPCYRVDPFGGDALAIPECPTDSGLEGFMKKYVSFSLSEYLVFPEIDNPAPTNANGSNAASPTLTSAGDKGVEEDVGNSVDGVEVIQPSESISELPITSPASQRRQASDEQEPEGKQSLTSQPDLETSIKSQPILTNQGSIDGIEPAIEPALAEIFKDTDPSRTPARPKIRKVERRDSVSSNSDGEGKQEKSEKPSKIEKLKMSSEELASPSKQSEDPTRKKLGLFSPKPKLLPRDGLKPAIVHVNTKPQAPVIRDPEQLAYYGKYIRSTPEVDEWWKVTFKLAPRGMPVSIRLDSKSASYYESYLNSSI